MRTLVGAIALAAFLPSSFFLGMPSAFAQARFAGPEMAKGQRFRIVEVRKDKMHSSWRGVACVAIDTMSTDWGTGYSWYTGTATCPGKTPVGMNEWFPTVGVELIGPPVVAPVPLVAPEALVVAAPVPMGIASIRFAQIVNPLDVYDQLDTVECLTWPSPEMKQHGGKMGWGTFRPKAGDIGEVVATPGGCNGTLLLLKIEGNYLPIAANKTIVPPVHGLPSSWFAGHSIPDGQKFRIVDFGISDRYVGRRPESFVGQICVAQKEMVDVQPGYFTGSASCDGKNDFFLLVAVEFVKEGEAPIPARIPDAAGARFTGDSFRFGHRFRILEIGAKDTSNYPNRAALIGSICTPQGDALGRSSTTLGFYTGKADCSGTVLFMAEVAGTLVDDNARPEDAAGNYVGRAVVPRGQRFHVTGLPAAADVDGKLLTSVLGKSCIATNALWHSPAGRGLFSGSMRCDGKFVSLPAWTLKLDGVTPAPAGAGQIVANGTSLPTSRLSILLPASAKAWHVSVGGSDRGPSDLLTRGPLPKPAVSVEVLRVGDDGCAFLAKGSGPPPGARPSWLPAGWTYLWSEDPKQTEKNGAACYTDALNEAVRADIKFGRGLLASDKTALSEVLQAIQAGVDPTTLWSN